MTLSINKLFLLVLAMLGLFSACSNSQNMNSSQSQNASQIEFTEERRLNHKIDLNEVTIINTLQELTELYSRMENPDVPRSAPIPPFNEKTESVLVIKPVLKNLVNGDIEIESIKKSKSKLTVNYKEIENWEYSENKWSNPIVIIKISDKPSEIKLNKIN